MSDVILEGTVGSTAYGLSTPDSDIDTLGVFTAPLCRVLSIGWNPSKASRVTTSPDSTHHEVAKFLGLVIKGNPTVTELLWLEHHSIETPAGRSLVAVRHKLLGSGPVRSAYLGYASQQVARLERRASEGRIGFSSDLAKRTAKHGRHCWRLLLQAEHALKTGEICVDVSEHAEQIFAIGDLAESDPTKLRAAFEVKVEKIKGIESVLPELPDVGLANRILFSIRTADTTDS